MEENPDEDLGVHGELENGDWEDWSESNVRLTERTQNGTDSNGNK